MRSRSGIARFRDWKQVLALFGVWLLLFDSLVAVPLSQQIMSPIRFENGVLEVCTSTGLIKIDASGKVAPGSGSDQDMPSCPFCFPFFGGAATLAAPPVLLPATVSYLVAPWPILARQVALRFPQLLPQPRGPPSRI